MLEVRRATTWGSLCNVNVNLSRVYLYFGLAGIRIRVEISRAPSEYIYSFTWGGGG